MIGIISLAIVITRANQYGRNKAVQLGNRE
jgi:hypothetical protein